MLYPKTKALKKCSSPHYSTKVVFTTFGPLGLVWSGLVWSGVVCGLATPQPRNPAARPLPRSGALPAAPRIGLSSRICWWQMLAGGCEVRAACSGCSHCPEASKACMLARRERFER